LAEGGSEPGVSEGCVSWAEGEDEVSEPSVGGERTGQCETSMGDRGMMVRVWGPEDNAVDSWYGDGGFWGWEWGKEVSWE
jgi:hypothetical protein